MLLELFKEGGAQAVRQYLESLPLQDFLHICYPFRPAPVYGWCGCRLFKFLSREDLTNRVVSILEGANYGK